MSNWKGKSTTDKPFGLSKPTAPNTSNMSNMSLQHGTPNTVISFLGRDKTLSLFSDTSELPTYFRELRPSRTMRTESITTAEDLANRINSLSAECPFTSRRDEQMRYPPCSSNYSSRTRIKNESVSLNKHKKPVTKKNAVLEPLKCRYICCHCQTLNESTAIGSHCLTKLHLECFNAGIVCPSCFKYTE